MGKAASTVRFWKIGLLTAFALAVVPAARASTLDMDHWFMGATAFNATTTAVPMKKPDFLGGSLSKQCAFPYNGKLPNIQSGLWQLVKYDRKHGIGLAYATTDQCSSAVFAAPPPPQAAPDADLSKYGTARGLKIGSPYSDVAALYGPQTKHGGHFVVSYSADVPHASVTGKPVKLPETITIVIDKGSVSAITVVVEEGGLF